MRNTRRKTAPKVVNGRVQRKSRHGPSNDYRLERRVAIERRRAGYDCRHVLTTDEVYSFINRLPNWNRWAVGLSKIILDEGSETRFGWFRRGEIGLCAMPRDLKVRIWRDYFYRDQDFFDKYGVPYEEVVETDDFGMPIERPNEFDCQFTRATARCFTLLRTLTHELGHHHDRRTNRKGWCSRGEVYAERIRETLEKELESHYIELFGWPR
jgi:hypothetical protein